MVSLTFSMRIRRESAIKGTQIIRKRASIGMKFWQMMKMILPMNIPDPIMTEMVPMTEERMPDGVDSAGMVRISVSDMDHSPPMEMP